MGHYTNQTKSEKKWTQRITKIEQLLCWLDENFGVSKTFREEQPVTGCFYLGNKTISLVGYK